MRYKSLESFLFLFVVSFHRWKSCIMCVQSILSCYIFTILFSTCILFINKYKCLFLLVFPGGFHMWVISLSSSLLFVVIVHFVSTRNSYSSPVSSFFSPNPSLFIWLFSSCANCCCVISFASRRLTTDGAKTAIKVCLCSSPLNRQAWHPPTHAVP